jgi:predicted amidohydrolase YtcJ
MKKFISIITFTSVIVFLVSMGQSMDAERIDLVLFNGNIITVDANKTVAEAVAVSDGRIAFVGNSEYALLMADKDTRKIDLKGKTLVPGFNDNHTHSFGAGSFFLQPLLWGKSCEEVAEVVKVEASKKRPGELITGSSWDYPTCPAPHKSILDDAAPDNPVFLTQYSGHGSWVNSRMLDKMGIDKNTKDPEGGQIVRDENGEPTGVLRDTASGSAQYSQFVKQLLVPSRHDEVINKMLTLYKEAGITSVQDNTWEPITARKLMKMHKKGKLTCRFTCWPYGQAKGLPHLMHLASFNDEWVRKGPWKYFADGAFSTRTGWLSKPYADEPGNYGSPRHTPEELDKIYLKAAKSKQQLAMHAIGDQAIHELLNAIEKAQETYPKSINLRHRFEHVQLVMPEDIARMKKLGVIACVQPFTISSPDKDLVLLGPERAKRAYMFKTLFKKGIPVSFGSDVPAEVDYNPLLNIYYAVTRMNKAGTLGPLNPDECFTPYEALYCYTMGSAYAEFMENEKGSIEKGKLADMVVLSEDLTKVPPQEIKNIEALMTIVGGKIVYEK